MYRTPGGIIPVIISIAAIILLIGGIYLLLGPYILESNQYVGIDFGPIHIETDNDRIGTGILCIVLSVGLLIVRKSMVGRNGIT